MATPGEAHRIFSKFDSIDAFDLAMHEYDTRQEVLDVNRDQLHTQGELSTGKKIKPKYSSAYQKYKQRRGSKTTPTPDIYDSGDTSDSMDVRQVKKGEYEVTTQTYYTKYLVNRYSINLFGIAKKNIGKAKKVILPTIQGFQRRLLKL